MNNDKILIITLSNIYILFAYVLHNILYSMILFTVKLQFHIIFSDILFFLDRRNQYIFVITEQSYNKSKAHDYSILKDFP